MIFSPFRRFCSVRFLLVPFGSSRFGSVPFGRSWSARPGSVWFGCVLGSALFGSARFGSVRSVRFGSLLLSSVRSRRLLIHGVLSLRLPADNYSKCTAEGAVLAQNMLCIRPAEGNHGSFSIFQLDVLFPNFPFSPTFSTFVVGKGCSGKKVTCCIKLVCRAVGVAHLSFCSACGGITRFATHRFFPRASARRRVLSVV